ncbi:hypothetical protein [uncultured Draconibacterium sp.]|uniref:hypothetical protein n=1 Tax=uncultured Draconibacterium sp. TaxID=1573823 RepID=UPI0025E16BA1|nr:hypothetical protein [uncultured Draconibacterium sp.]
MKKRITPKLEIRDKVDKLLLHEEFITWRKLGIYLKDRKKRYLTYEARIVFDYMKELGIEYLHYSDKYSDGRLHRNTGGFYNPIPITKRRKNKLQQIIENYKN